MNTAKKITISGMGKCLPSRRVLSSDLEKKLGIPAGWTERYTGVLERRYVEDESGALLGARALEEALSEAGISFGDLDMLLCGSSTFDYLIPNMACVIKDEVTGGKEHDTPAMCLDSTCLSFVAAVDMATTLLDGERYKKIAVVSVEIASNGLNPNDWETATLFGDGAAAAIVEWTPDGVSEIMKAGMRTYSEGVFNTQVKGGGNAFFFREHPYDPALHSFAMKGKNLLRMAKKRIPEFMDAFFSDLDLKITDVDLVIPHQASKMGLMLFFSLYPFRSDAFYGNLKHMETVFPLRFLCPCMMRFGREG